MWVSRSASRSRSVCRGTSGVWLPGPLSRVVKDATPSGHLPPPTHRCAPLTVSRAEEGFPAPPHPTTPSPELGTSSSPHGGQDSDWALVPGGSQAQTDTLLPQSCGLSAVHGEPGRAAFLSASPPLPSEPNAGPSREVAVQHHERHPHPPEGGSAVALGEHGVRRAPAACRPLTAQGGRAAASRRGAHRKPARTARPRPHNGTEEPAPASSRPPASARALGSGTQDWPLHPGRHGCIPGTRKREDPKPPPPGSRLPRPELTPAPPAPARAAQGLSSQSGPSPPKTKRGRTGSQQKGVETAAPPPTREADEEKRLQLHDPPDPGWHLLPLTAERASSPRPEEKATLPSAGPGTRTGTVPGEHPPAHELGGTAAPLHPQSPRGRPHGLNTSTRVCTCPRLRACVCTHLYLCTHSLYTYIRTCVHLHTHMLTHMDTSTCTRTQTRRVCTMLQSVCAC